ncbi:MAG: hotdog fold thioesterase [Thermodesulfobacteriota bacterium]|nr:hotdog fold thioesterase [Thermodesulfobacteriota bacterium]
MTDKEHYGKLEQMYISASCNEYYSPKLSVSKGAAEIVIPVQEKFFHAAGATHGAVYFKALDDAAFFACNSVVKDFLVLTVNFNVYLIRPVSSGQMRGVGRVVHASRNLMIAESELFDSKGREIARGNGTFVKSKIRLSPDVGYELS